MTEFKICGISVKIDFSFLMISALAAIFGTAETLKAIAAVCAVHELGHAMALYICGGRMRSITFFAAGIKMEPQSSKLLSLGEEALILLSGPMSNLFLSAVLGAYGCFGEVFMLSIGAAAFNLLPYSSLDGGSLIILLTAGSRKALCCMKTVQILISAALLTAVLEGCSEAAPVFVASVMYFVFS
ncbi:MAG: hypothetical protein PUA81_00320 [Oscillospiraceae bacterium]|nr:hypothetical protein [Oscillospiraceae bacterium]